jgi:hypothetical protein
MSAGTSKAILILSALLIPASAMAEVPSPDRMGSFLGAVLEAIQGRRWDTLVVLALVAVIWGLRKLGTKLPMGIGAFFATSEGGTVFALISSSVAALAAAFYGGLPLSGSLVVNALEAGFAAIGAWVGARRLLRLVVPLVATVPRVGASLAAGLSWLLGLDADEAIAKKTDTAYQPPQSVPETSRVAQGLDEPTRTP